MVQLFWGQFFEYVFIPFETSNFDHFLFISFSCLVLCSFISYSILIYFLLISYSFPIEILCPIQFLFLSLFISYSIPIQFLFVSYSIPIHFQLISYLFPFHVHSFLFISFDLRNLPKFQKVWICFFYQSLI